MERSIINNALLLSLTYLIFLRPELVSQSLCHSQETNNVHINLCCQLSGILFSFVPNPNKSVNVSKVTNMKVH